MSQNPASHERACINAIASIGGDPATVGEMVEALELAYNDLAEAAQEEACAFEHGDHRTGRAAGEQVHEIREKMRSILNKLPTPPA